MYTSPLLWLCLASTLMPALSKVIWTDGDEDGNATLVCPQDMRTQWITPGHMVIHPDIPYDEEKYMIFTDNSSLLTVMKLGAKDAGVYFCGIPTESRDRNDDGAVQVELHVKLPYHDTDYTDNAVTGVVVACVVALIFGGSCLLYKYRYREKSYTDMEVVIDTAMKQKMQAAAALPPKQDRSPILVQRSVGEGCENPALDRSDDESSSSDDEKSAKKEDVPLGVTSEQGESPSKNTEETGM